MEPVGVMRGHLWQFPLSLSLLAMLRQGSALEQQCFSCLIKLKEFFMIESKRYVIPVLLYGVSFDDMIEVFGRRKTAENHKPTCICLMSLMSVPCGLG